MDVQAGSVPVCDLAAGITASFEPLAREKGLGLNVSVLDHSPVTVFSDRKRIEQILRNLVSNAIKFTEQGHVSVTFGRPDPHSVKTVSETFTGECLTVIVEDTGIGIAAQHQQVIFEAFKQVDSGISRKYGGTGLGLSISRQLAHLLGGSIHVDSEQGKGSRFTLCLPVMHDSRNRGETTARNSNPSDRFRLPSAQQSAIPAIPLQVTDDRECLQTGDRVVLVIEDDANFSRLLLEKCRDKGLKCLVASTGEAGLELAFKHIPCAVILDLRLPGIDGYSVLTTLKGDSRTRHIPVHVVSVEEYSSEALRKGAIGHAVKPLDQERMEDVFRRLDQVSAKKHKRLLVVEDDPVLRRTIIKLVGNGDVVVTEAETGKQAMDAFRSHDFDCVVLDLKLPDMDGAELISTLKQQKVQLPPIIIHTARELTNEEEMALREHADSIVIKDVRSQERLLDEVSLFLHRVVGKMSDAKRKMIQNLHETDAAFKEKRVLIVDDDMRTTFALSHLLSECGMKPVKAENGERALRILSENPQMDIVLMDLMMPGMDGFEAIRRIRMQEQFTRLPIIVLTAKAMPEDREKCLRAGANDYLPKPVDRNRLLSMLRVWLHR